MRKQDAGVDYHRYQQLLAEAVDEKKRLELIDLLIEERARERLEARTCHRPGRHDRLGHRQRA